MIQPAATRPTALVVEDDEFQRMIAKTILEESDMKVIQCNSAEAAARVLDEHARELCMLFTDVNLSGEMTGAELAAMASERCPGIKIIVTSGKELPQLPSGTIFLRKPWMPAELIREACLACGD